MKAIFLLPNLSTNKLEDRRQMLRLRSVQATTPQPASEEVLKLEFESVSVG